MISTVDEWKQVLRCPVCLRALEEAHESLLRCRSCELSYRHTQNVPILIPEQYRWLGRKEQSELWAQRKAHTQHYEEHLTNEKVHNRIADLLRKHEIITNQQTRILEIGPGPFESLHNVGAGVKIALDPLASSYQQHLPIERSQSNIVEGMSEVLPFATGYFDIVVSRNSFDHLNHPELALLEFNRVLRQNGGLCIIECYIDSDPFAVHEPFVLTDAFVDKYIALYFDILTRKRIPKPKGFCWDWVELVLSPKAVSLPHRPYELHIFEDVSNSYLELFSKGYELISQGAYDDGIACLKQSLAKNPNYFWTAVALWHSLKVHGRKEEAREALEQIESNMERGAYPYISSPREELSKAIRKLNADYMTRLQVAFP